MKRKLTAAVLVGGATSSGRTRAEAGELIRRGPQGSVRIGCLRAGKRHADIGES